MNIKRINIELPQLKANLSLKVYGSEESFLEHCDSHILKRNDCWSTFLEKDITDNARSAKMIGDKGSIYVYDLYDAVVKVISEELDNSVSRPLYCSIASGRKKKGFKEYLFLSSSGMRIIADTFTIRTGFWGVSLPYSQARQFERSCDSFVRKMIKAKSLGKKVIQVTEKNWAKCSGSVKRIRSKHYNFVSGNTYRKTGRW